MEPFVANQIKFGLKHLPSNMLKSFMISSSNEATVAMREKGFIKGVCHPRGDIDVIRDANIEWIRIDIPFPFDKEGNVRENFYGFREKCKTFADKGIKVMAVTPYPEDYIEYGLDPRNRENEQEIKKIAIFMLNELRDVIGGLQITNEMGMPQFTLPLTVSDAAHFIGIQLEALYPVKGNIITGYNSAGPQADLHEYLLPYHRYCDYVGIDMYLGCFASFPGFMWMFDAMIRYLYAFTGLPVLIQEFGYISGGAPKSDGDRREILRRYGAESEDDARANIEEFVNNLPEKLAKHVRKIGENNPERYGDILFKSDVRNHFYCEMPHITKIPGYDHTPEGQAKFYSDVLKHFYDIPFCCGAIIYCYSDDDMCYVCGQNDCPIETRWGLVDRDYNPKASYYAVKEQFGKMK